MAASKVPGRERGALHTGQQVRQASAVTLVSVRSGVFQSEFSPPTMSCFMPTFLHALVHCRCVPNLAQNGQPLA